MTFTEFTYRIRSIAAVAVGVFFLGREGLHYFSGTAFSRAQFELGIVMVVAGSLFVYWDYSDSKSERRSR